MSQNQQLPTKPILCLDFDGVCHSYTSGWINAWTIPDPPVPGLFPFLEEAMQYFRVCVHSSRSADYAGRGAMRDWFAGWVIAHYAEHTDKVALAEHLMGQLEFPDSKPSAFVTLDDRAITFTGVWPAIEQLKSFKPWNDHLKRRPNTEKAANPAPNP